MFEVYCCVRSGGGIGQIWMDNVYCDGFELRIEDCRYNGWGLYNCGYYEDLFINCLLFNGLEILFLSLNIF